MNTVLVIDDEEICLEQIKLFLDGRYEVLTASGGQEGLDIINDTNNKIDIVLLDLMMPDIHGLEVLKQIKSNDNLKLVTVIMQTGTSNQAEVNKALELGAKSCIIKPFKRANLIDEIKKYVS